MTVALGALFQKSWSSELKYVPPARRSSRNPRSGPRRSRSSPGVARAARRGCACGRGRGRLVEIDLVAAQDLDIRLGVGRELGVGPPGVARPVSRPGEARAEHDRERPFVEAWQAIGKRRGGRGCQDRVPATQVDPLPAADRQVGEAGIRGSESPPPPGSPSQPASWVGAPFAATTASVAASLGSSTAATHIAALSGPASPGMSRWLIGRSARRDAPVRDVAPVPGGCPWSGPPNRPSVPPADRPTPKGQHPSGDAATLPRDDTPARRLRRPTPLGRAAPAVVRASPSACTSHAAARDGVRRLGRDADRAVGARHPPPHRLPDLRHGGLAVRAAAAGRGGVPGEPVLGGVHGAGPRGDPDRRPGWACAPRSRRRRRSGRAPSGRSGGRRRSRRSTRSISCWWR